MFIASGVAYLASYFGKLYLLPEATSALASFGVVVTGLLHHFLFISHSSNQTVFSTASTHKLKTRFTQLTFNIFIS
jgi:6,7-dimethyl-8-ribityllumazine synthase